MVLRDDAIVLSFFSLALALEDETTRRVSKGAPSRICCVLGLVCSIISINALHIGLLVALTLFHARNMIIRMTVMHTVPEVARVTNDNGVDMLQCYRWVHVLHQICSRRVRSRHSAHE